MAAVILSGFNPRARVGRDCLVDPEDIVVYEFQSTRPRGARRLYNLEPIHGQRVSIHAPAWGATLACYGCIYRLPRFNPRARVGRDYMHFNYMHYIKIIQ